MYLVVPNDIKDIEIYNEKGIDTSFADVIKRADATMYEYKEALKK